MTVFANVIFHCIASFLLHGCVVGLVLVFSSGVFTPEEKVYRVMLPDFSAPAKKSGALPLAGAAPALPKQREQAKPETAVEQARPAPKETVKETPKPETKTVSAKKNKAKPKPARKDAPAAPQPQTPPARTAAPADSAASSGVAGASLGEASGDSPGESAGGPSGNLGGLVAYDVDTVDQRPAIARMVVPEYPRKARRMNVQGKVFVHLVVDASGFPKECAIHKADPAGYFEDAALAAARKTRFIPGKVKGRAVNTVVLVPFVFALR